MSPETFSSYSQAGFNRIPVVREILADLDTPLSAYLRLADRPYTYLFESVQGGERWGRYSMIGLPAEEVIRLWGNRLQCLRVSDGAIQEQELDDPIQWLESYRQRFRAPEVAGLPRFNGGLVGYFGYDSVRYFEPRLGRAPGRDPLGVPDVTLMRSEELVVFDNLRGSLFLLVMADPAVPDALAVAERRLDVLEEKLQSGVPDRGARLVAGLLEPDDIRTEFSRDAFEASVARIREYILAGDVMQVVLAQRMSVPYNADPLSIYRALRYLNPSPYMFFLDLDETQVAGSSPEILTRVEQDRVTVRPIAGTRHRGRTPEEDLALEAELLADPKEQAEHLMLIDLGRNDVGRIAAAGSVRLTENMQVERYSHVMHIVSNVEGQLRAGMGPLDVLRATFPAGTLSGAPKIRAMEIIDELEPVKRGIYGGAIGYIGFNGEMDTAIAIRTGVIHGGRLYVQAGAGVVADSVPALEWQETLNKGRAVFAAVNMALQGLSLKGETP